MATSFEACLIVSTSNINGGMNESLFQDRWSFLVPQLSCFLLLFQEIWYKSSKGIGLRMYGKFFFITFVLLKS